MLVNDKRSSLQRHGILYGLKNFYYIGLKFEYQYNLKRHHSQLSWWRVVTTREEEKNEFPPTSTSSGANVIKHFTAIQFFCIKLERLSLASLSA